jgi:hypothetical protein
VPEGFKGEFRVEPSVDFGPIELMNIPVEGSVE